jgi:hypothetical protein
MAHGMAGADQRQDLHAGRPRRCLLLQAGFKAAPLGISPVVTRRHNATSSLRARATTAIRRGRPFVLPTRAQNYWRSALSG